MLGKPASFEKAAMRLSLSLALALILAPLLFAQQPAKPPAVTVPEGVVFERDVEYANPDNQHLQLNIARPKEGDGPFPAVVCIHGGGFRAGNREGYNGTILKLARRGYVAITVTYRPAPKHQFPAAVQHTKAT